jgi:hypothetical protein
MNYDFVLWVNVKVSILLEIVFINNSIGFK